MIRTRSDDDRRAAFATITEKGKALRKRWIIYQGVIKDYFISQFSEDEITRFTQASMRLPIKLENKK